MKTIPMVLTAANELLFDDRSLLEHTLGKDALNVSAVNANCDCIGYSTTDDEDLDTDQVTPTAR